MNQIKLFYFVIVFVLPLHKEVQNKQIVYFFLVKYQFHCFGC